MEAAKEEKSAGLLNQIVPPRLEDAGLEDCALPAESIHEAFLKAASAVKSRASALFYSDDDEDEDPGCLQDPWPDNAKEMMPDDLTDAPLPDGSDRVVVGGVPDPDASVDKVIVGGGDVEAEGEGGIDCVDDGLKGLNIGEDEKKKSDEEEEKKPILVEGYV